MIKENESDLCNNGRCYRVRMGENRHNVHKKWNSNFQKYISYEKKVYNLISVIFLPVVLFVYLAQFDPNITFIPDNPIELLTLEFTILGTYSAIMFAIANRFHKFKELQVNTLSRVFQLLSTEDVRKARRIVHEEYCRLKKSSLPIKFEKSKENPNLEDQVDLVLSSFDQVSVLVLNRLIDKELFYDTYGEMIVRDWKTLETEIIQRQNKNPKAVHHFTVLKEEFESRDDIGNTEPYCVEN